MPLPQSGKGAFNMELDWWDISRDMMTAPVYPGDPEPSLEHLSELRLGDECNTSVLHACVHTGTHMDAPGHFLPKGATAEQIPLSLCCGPCAVIEQNEPLVGAQVESYSRVLRGTPRLLLKGNVTVTPSAASELASIGVKLVGVEGVSVASPKDEGDVHRLLLGAGVLILEGLDLSTVESGRYLLIAAPIKLRGADGAPVRALLVRQQTVDL